VRIAALISVLLVAAGAASRGPATAAQVTQPLPPRFRTGIDVVEVAVLVKDRAGKPVTDLTRNEITVLENGAPQTLVAFERVSIPARAASSPAGVPEVPKDVTSNEVLGPARVFMLVLDSHHVAATRVRAVQTHARQFIESYIRPGDYAAVFSPGALAAATQDFTTDKARLIAAVNQFTGMKMGSAVVEVERERAAAAGVRGAIPMHAGHDPSDSERTDRAVALAGTLEALANHLERISGRRKTLLLFSEGIDYDQADVLGKVQRNASEVMRGMGRAIGALMRSNVALYAVDPRALNSADADLLETPIYNPSGAATRTVADEQTDSIRNLHSLSESTGGFAAVNRNDFTSAFERIDLESSSYYVVGYSPERPAKPGEFRSIQVKVSRPDVRISARNGYSGKAETTVRRTVTDYAASEPTSGFPMPSARGRGRAPEPINVPTASPATRGLSSPLQELLASPLPQAGLPMRLQAVTLRTDGRKSDVRLVIEVLGGSLRFEERGGRFNERLELALMTVNDSGRASNGTSIDIDLRLTPEDLARVKGTGVRWLSALSLPPGRHQLRVAGRAGATGASGMITHDIVVPEIRRAGLDMSGVTITSVPSVLMITRGKAWLDRALPTPPTAARRFVAGDQMVAAVEVYRPEKGAPDGTVTARIERADGSPAGSNERRAVHTAGPRTEEIGVPIDTAKLPAGQYVLRMTLEAAGGERVERVIPFEVVTR
jgi:VWFA-related protein